MFFTAPKRRRPFTFLTRDGAATPSCFCSPFTYMPSLFTAMFCRSPGAKGVRRRRLLSFSPAQRRHVSPNAASPRVARPEVFTPVTTLPHTSHICFIESRRARSKRHAATSSFCARSMLLLRSPHRCHAYGGASFVLFWGSGKGRALRVCGKSACVRYSRRGVKWRRAARCCWTSRRLCARTCFAQQQRAARAVRGRAKGSGEVRGKVKGARAVPCRLPRLFCGEEKDE